MARTIVDIAFSVVVFIGMCICYFYTDEMTPGEFYIALMINYIGTRYLLMSDLDFAIYTAALESEDE